MEEEPKKGFRYWFTNIFWYHYGKIALLALVLLITVVWLTVDALHKEKYDLNMCIAANGPVTEQMRRDVAANVWRDSLLNWVKSFR